MLYESYKVFEISWADFSCAFEKKYLLVDILHIKALEFFNLK